MKFRLRSDRHVWPVSLAVLLMASLLSVVSCSHRRGEGMMRAQPDQKVTGQGESATEPDKELAEAVRSFAMPWLQQPAELWQRDFSGSARDDEVPLPAGDLKAEGIGTMTRVYGLFDRWSLKDEITTGRGRHYADITGQCRGSVELDFALTAQQWADPQTREGYYRAVEELIEKIGTTLLSDFGDRLQGQERDFFLRALKTLAWQESQWQHYLRYGDWFFVIVSGGSYNKLDDWGITQIARSSFQADVLLNTNFFDSRGYCSLSSSLYYGFMEYYFCYLEARENPENGPGLFNKIVGAYNRYSSGYSSSCFDLAEDGDYRNYQIKALGGFKDRFIAQPWREAMSRQE